MKKILLSLVVLAFAPALHATTITGLGMPSDHSSLATGVLIDFESDTPGNTATLVYAGVTLTGSMGNTGEIGVESLSGFNTTGQHISLRRQEEAQAIRFDFHSLANAFGMNIGGTNKNWTLTAYSAADVILDLFNIPPNNPSDQKEWYGLIAPDIAYATLVNTDYLQAPGSNTQDYITIDNFTYNSVPSPAPLMLITLGLIGLVFTRKVVASNT